MKNLLLCLLGLLASASANADHPKFRRAKQNKKVQNEYIVILEDGFTMEDLQASAEELILSSANSAIIDVYGKVVNGFSVRLPESALTMLLSDPAVKLVEEVSPALIP